LCHTGIVYARTIKDRALTLGVSGKLWEGNLVLVDRETETLWSQMLGWAMRGPLEGEVLELLPSVMTDWGTWKKRHPQTTAAIMRRTSNRYVRSLIGPDSGHILAIAKAHSSRCWSFTDLFREEAINDSFGDIPVVATFDASSKTASLFDRRVNGRVLTFEGQDGLLIDQQTKSEWDPVTGIAVTPPMKGTHLIRLPAIISDHAVWTMYHPKTTLWHSRPASGQSD